MGCGASSRAAVAPEVAEAAVNGEARHDDLRVASAGTDSELGAATTAPPTPAPGGGPTQVKEVAPAAPSTSPLPRRTREPPMAFEVPVLEESLIKKHPPKRFQRLEEQQVSSPLSLELLEERQSEARHRRIQILNQRVQSAKMRLPKKLRIAEDDGSVVEDTIESVRCESSSVEL